MSEKVNAYAKALVLIGRADNRLADVEDELFQFATILKSNDQLRNTLNDKNIAIEERIAVINVVLEGKALNTTKGIQLIRSLNLESIETVPSLFSFNIPNSALAGLEGLSLENCEIQISESKFSVSGPIKDRPG